MDSLYADVIEATTLDILDRNGKRDNSRHSVERVERINSLIKYTEQCRKFLAKYRYNLGGCYSSNIQLV